MISKLRFEIWDHLYTYIGNNNSNGQQESEKNKALRFKELVIMSYCTARQWNSGSRNMAFKISKWYHFM
jgi:hypothetical protein